MNIITSEFIRSFSEYNKYNFTNEVYNEISKDVEFLLREIIEVY